MALAKTAQPGANGALRRPRLYRLLSEGVRRRLTWVSGPPGSGKTTLVAGFLTGRQRQSLWYHVDAGDSDIASVFYYLARAAPARPGPLPLFTPEYRASVSAFTRGYFRLLYERLSPSFTLVFDNYQEVPDDALLHDVLRDALDELPPDGRVVVISRKGPPAALARLQVNDPFPIIDGTQLRATVTEARQLAEKHGRLTLPLAEVRNLHRLADGWMAGLVLLLRQRADCGTIVASEPPDVLFDYFATEIFDRTTRYTRDILLRTALLPVVRPDMASALTGRPGVESVLASLHRMNYFTDRVTGSGGGYRYHPLFRTFLLARARREWSGRRLAGLQAKAAHLLEEAGDIPAAADLLTQARDWAALGVLIRRHAPLLLRQGRVDTLEGWLERIPERVFDQDPWLLCWRGTCRLGRSHQLCRIDLERAFGELDEGDDIDGALMAWTGIVSSHLMQGHLVPLDFWIPILDDVLKRPGRHPSDDTIARVSSTMLIAIAFRQPWHPQVALWADRALSLTTHHPDRQLRCLAVSGWVLLHWLTGQGPRAVPVVREMRAILRAAGTPPIEVLHAAVPVVWHEFFTGEPSYSDTVSRVRACVKASGLRHVLVSAVLGWGGFAAINAGDLESGTTWARELDAEATGAGATYELASRGLAAFAALSRGDLHSARMHVDELARRGFDAGYVGDVPLGHALAAQVDVASGLIDSAEDHVRAALKALRARPVAYCEWSVRLTEACVSFAAGRTADGFEALAVAMRIGRQGDYVASQVVPARVLANLCARALRVSIETDYVRQIVTCRQLSCEPEFVDLPTWPWPVKVFTFGRLSVEIDGQPLRLTRKVPRKLLSLLAILAASGQQGASEEQIMDTLWPEADGDSARRALTTAVFRLRRLVHEASVMRSGGRLALNPAVCWVDVWALERVLDRNEAAVPERGPRADGTSLAMQALDLYRGPLTGAGENDWSTSRDRHLREKLHHQLVAVSQICATSGHWQRAANLLEAALSLDPCAELACRLLMTSYHHLQRPASVKRAYDQCRRALDGEMGLRPSEATEAAFARLHTPPTVRIDD